MNDQGLAATLERWTAFGGVWRVLTLSDRVATVSLCRCDGGEEAERHTVTDPDDLQWLRRVVDAGQDEGPA